MLYANPDFIFMLVVMPDRDILRNLAKSLLNALFAACGNYEMVLAIGLQSVLDVC